MRSKRSETSDHASANATSPRFQHGNHAGSAPFPIRPVLVRGRTLIPPNTSFARAVTVGNESSHPNEARMVTMTRETRAGAAINSNVRPMSNLSVLLNQHEMEEIPEGTSRRTTNVGGAGPTEADSGSGPPRASKLCSSAPSPHLTPSAATSLVLPAMARQNSTADTPRVEGSHLSAALTEPSGDVGSMAQISRSPYQHMMSKREEMMSKREEIEVEMKHRLQTLREANPVKSSTSDQSEESLSSVTRPVDKSNKMRNLRRAQHAQAVVDDLCDVVADLFIAESKLLNPTTYGVPEESNIRREQVMKTIRAFVSALPMRYALGVETPSEVLLHMRLMAVVAQANKTKAAVHIHNLEDDSNWTRTASSHPRSLRLVTICCYDAVGLLEYITKLLATGGSRVVDADVQLSAGGVVLDRFVVEMTGRLRLDKLANLIEAFLKDSSSSSSSEQSVPDSALVVGEKSHSTSSLSEPAGPLYHRQAHYSNIRSPPDISQELKTAVPLADVIAFSFSSPNLLQGVPGLTTQVAAPRSRPPIRQVHSGFSSASAPLREGSEEAENQNEGNRFSSAPFDSAQPSEAAPGTQHLHERGPLVNRRATFDLDNVGGTEDMSPEYRYGQPAPMIPFGELMLIETLGTGRVSTIYRAAWRRAGARRDVGDSGDIRMVALKVAMVDTMTGDTSHVDELRREADIATGLAHPNICRLAGVSADAECFCLAYDFCEGGSLLSLLADSSRYYEYLPIALDVANGMAYLHSRNVIHRDLKPSNILLTRDHRARIADFGMSVANTGQELTAETGTYRYMAPEVIRHESYSSNADVYSFGICLWQLVTREIPFAAMTPIQAAYAVAEGRRPEIPPSTPRRIQEIIMACWDQDSHRRPSFTYITMAMAEYARMAFSPANVGTQTLHIANEMIDSVAGQCTVNVDISTPFASTPSGMGHRHSNTAESDIGLEIE